MINYWAPIHLLLPCCSLIHDFNVFFDHIYIYKHTNHGCMYLCYTGEIWRINFQSQSIDQSINLLLNINSAGCNDDICVGYVFSDIFFLPLFVVYRLKLLCSIVWCGVVRCVCVCVFVFVFQCRLSIIYHTRCTTICAKKKKKNFQFFFVFFSL